MKCPYCDYMDSKVIDSRPTEDGSTIRRRRACLSCQKRFTTYETVDKVSVLLIKRDGSRQLYNRQKLKAGILRACEKRPIGLEQIDQLIDRVEQILFRKVDSEISSVAIGELVLQELKTLDEVAYIRFASVYRQFNDLDSFMHELRQLMGENKA